MLDNGPTPAMDERIAALRRFSRHYTRVIGVLQEGLLQSRFSLTEARVLYELAHQPGFTATALGRELGLDAGYLSRILARFTQEGLLERRSDAEDRRQSALSLTDAGAAAFTPLDASSCAQAAALLAPLPEYAQAELIAAMARIEALLGDRAPSAWRLREPRAGDIGWVVSRHGALYAQEYGFDARFEALVAQVAGAFLAQHDQARERCWIAEHRGAPVGSVFLVRVDDELARLRLLLVEPGARGLGIGRQLVATCIGFAREAGYRRMTLWTNDVLVAARAIYQAAGFRLTRSEHHSMFGPAMTGEDWDLEL